MAYFSSPGGQYGGLHIHIYTVRYIYLYRIYGMYLLVYIGIQYTYRMYVPYIYRYRIYSMTSLTFRASMTTVRYRIHLVDWNILLLISGLFNYKNMEKQV